jgi:type VI protein secretion system component Hcp
MPIRYYLKLVGHTSGWINGDSTDTEYPNWIDGPSWSLDTPTRASFTSTGGPSAKAHRSSIS